MSEEMTNELEAEVNTNDVAEETVAADTSVKEKIAENVEKAAAPEETAKEAAPVEPAYVPNYKIKSYDSEYEIPETFRGLMTKENEKAFREVFEKAYGLDNMKPKYQKAQESLKATSAELTNLKKSIDYLGQFIDSRDFDNFFSRIGVRESDVMDWVRQKLELRQMSPEQQRVYQERVALNQQNFAARAEMDRLRAESETKIQAYQEEMDKIRMSQLDGELSKPDVAAIANAYDAKNGAGAFRSEVIERAAYAYQTKGIDMSAQQAVENMMKFFTLNAGSVPQVPVQTPVAQPSNKPTIPNVSGKSSSPVSKSVKSLDDLKKLRKEAIGSMASEY